MKVRLFQENVKKPQKFKTNLVVYTRGMLDVVVNEPFKD